MRILLAALALVSMTAIAAGGPQWTWRDASGQLHASDMPPPASVPDKNILSRPTSMIRIERAQASVGAASSPRPAASGADPELEARRRRATEQQMEQQRQQQAQDARVRGENCERAKAMLQGLLDGQRMTRLNAQGEREALDDKARAEEIQRTRSVVASDCR